MSQEKPPTEFFHCTHGLGNWADCMECCEELKRKGALEEKPQAEQCVECPNEEQIKKQVELEFGSMTRNSQVRIANWAYSWLCDNTKLRSVDEVRAEDRAKIAALEDSAECEKYVVNQLTQDIIELEAQIQAGKTKAQVLVEALEKIEKHCICTRNVKGFDYGEKHPILGKAKIGARWLVPVDIARAALKKVGDVG